MEKIMLWLLFFGSLSVSSTTATGSFQPEQVHIAVGDNNQDMMITWVTQNDTQSSVVEFGTKYLNMSLTGISTKFTDGGEEKREMWMHRVLLKDLQPDTRYLYHCGSDLGWSDMFTFLTWIEGNEWPVRAAMYGDLGAINAQSLTSLQQEVAHGLYDAIIHVGDFAYDMNHENARVGDEFMKQIEPIAAYVPYMTCPGNHENSYNFSNYKARFSMPNYQVSENMFYSWNMGPAHFIAVNTEAYYYLNYGEAPLSNLWDWLINDLEQATKAEERAEHPWIILFGHRPMYCSNHGDSDCNNDANDKIRVGISGEYGMEELLYKYGVDMAVWAHKHCYERMFPVYNYTVMSGSTEAPYTNPKGPVHINTGSAGNQEDQTKFDPVQPEWSAFRAMDYGYTRFNIENMTHMYWEQVSVDKDGKIIDSMWLVKDEHGPYPELHPDNY